MTEGLRDRIASASDPRSATAGLVFHGTGEVFEAPLRPGAFDRVLWTADSPAIAQSYIPRSGASLLGAVPMSYERRQRPRPEGGFWHVVARAMGFDASDVERTPSGTLSSWRIPDGYPTHQEAEAWLQLQGYRPREGLYEVSYETVDGRDCIRPADWRLPGRLFIGSIEGLRLLDLASGRDGDLTDPDHLDLDTFARVEASGYDGLVINDFLQSKRFGNVGHRSFGLFASAASRMAWIETPAVNFDWEDDLTSSLTPEFEALWRDAQAVPALSF